MGGASGRLKKNKNIASDGIKQELICLPVIDASDTKFKFATTSKGTKVVLHRILPGSPVRNIEEYAFYCSIGGVEPYMMENLEEKMQAVVDFMEKHVVGATHDCFVNCLEKTQDLSYAFYVTLYAGVDGDPAIDFDYYGDGLCYFSRYYKREVPDGFKGQLHMITDVIFQKENPINNRVHALLDSKVFTLHQLLERYSGGLQATLDDPWIRDPRNLNDVWTKGVCYNTEGGMTILINHFYDLIRCFTKEVITQDCFGLFVFEDHNSHSWVEKPASNSFQVVMSCSKCLYTQTISNSAAETLRVYSRYLHHPACSPVANETFFAKFLEIVDNQLMLFPKLRNHEMNKIMRVSKRVLHICSQSAYWSHYARRIFTTWDQIPKLFELIQQRRYDNFRAPFSEFRFPLDMMKLTDRIEHISIDYFCAEANGATVTKRIMFDTGSSAVEILELLEMKEGQFRGLVNFKGTGYDRKTSFDRYSAKVQHSLLDNLHHACLLPWRTYEPGTAWYLVCDPAQFGLCAYCRKYFREEENTDRSCRYHPGKYGSRVTGHDSWGAHTYNFWDCCDIFYQDLGFDGFALEQGCASRKHRDIFKAGRYPVVKL